MATKQESVVNQENNYYDEIDEVLSSQYITIGPGEKKVLKFLPERGIAKVEKMYNGEPTEKCRFIVIDPNSESDAEKFIDVGKRSARLIVPKLDKIKEYSRTPLNFLLLFFFAPSYFSIKLV